MLKYIEVNSRLRTPKYRQIVKSVLRHIENGDIAVGEQLPSINTVSLELDLSRDTVVKAYKELRGRGVVEARHGKGFYISSSSTGNEVNICLLFNKLSQHKKVVYDAFLSHLGNNARVDLYIYNNDFDTFSELINRHLGSYTHFVIISHFYGLNRPVNEVLEKIPREKLIILDREVRGVHYEYPSIYQNFSKDILEAMSSAMDLLRRYDRLNLVFPDSSYHPQDIKTGFEAFCTAHRFDFRILPRFRFEALNIREAYIIMEESDLVNMLRTVKANYMLLGRDIGLISYNESPLKEFIADGLTVMSTDFYQMGKTAAEMVLKRKVEKIENPFLLIRRNSL